tara:strand:- start:752 stop:1753 length:1002 start_codon:yes stop_codon:yes gene_type:complete
MAFNRLAPEDFVVSSDSITGPLWSAGAPTLTKFYSSSVQEAGSSGDFYLNIYQTASTDTNAEIQFAIAYGNNLGSGSSWYNSAVAGASPTKTTYGQYRNLVLGDENSNFVFGGITSNDFWVISVDRNRYKESLLPGTMTLVLSGSGGKLSLTDNSNAVTSITFNDAGRVFQLVSGSAGVVNTTNPNGYSTNSGSYGWFLPDIGTLLLHPAAISSSIKVDANRASNTDGLNYRTLFNSLNLGATYTANSQETISSDYIFVRARNAEFNYSENPSFISGSTGEVIYNSFINNPQTYPTTIGLYNDTNELLAVAKLSRPLLKDFTKEALVRVKLDF